MIVNNTACPRSVLGAVIALAIATPAWAGEFFEKDGAVLVGHDAVSYFTEHKPVKGLVKFKAEYNGSTFYFSTKANHDTFISDPGRYAPQYGGYCAFGTAKGYKASIDPTAFTVVGGKLYMNYNRDVQKLWSADIVGFVIKADQNWPEVSIQTKVVE